ncbi:kelch domain-containing protein 9 [Sorex araneus]|uniref:kelch domain-containing protein 9 n=1 Tax=Sorex araneus TaxID=42254 RepID=UPI0003317D0B|nr:kelch domain-containing protein 9 [Sorex araneus]
MATSPSPTGLPSPWQQPQHPGASADQPARGLRETALSGGRGRVSMETAALCDFAFARAASRRGGGCWAGGGGAGSSGQPAAAGGAMAGAGGWTWRPVLRDALLARGFHSCTELRGSFYVVGGLLAGGSLQPSADTVVFDPVGGRAERLNTRDGPGRSHHEAVAVGGRWLCVVGGWDGAQRLATVAALDTEHERWEAWAAAPGSRVPAGLSSHTCTRVSERELRVVGREGGTRTQRRYGSVFTLRLDPDARAYSYTEESYRTASRSGHCAALLQTPGPHPGHQLLIVGGCLSPESEVAGHWSWGKIKEEPPAAPRLTEELARLVSGRQGTLHGPKGLRHHSCTVVGPFAVIFGGETLTRARDTVCNDLYVLDARRVPPRWFRFPCAEPGLKRLGHRTCLWGDQLYLVGGLGADGRPASPEVCVLDLFS